MTAPKEMPEGETFELSVDAAGARPNEIVEFFVTDEKGDIVQGLSGVIDGGRGKAKWTVSANGRALPVKISIKAVLRGKEEPLGDSTIVSGARARTLGWLDAKGDVLPVDPVAKMGIVQPGETVTLVLDVDDGHGRVLGEPFDVTLITELDKGSGFAESGRTVLDSKGDGKTFKPALPIPADQATPVTVRVRMEARRKGETSAEPSLGKRVSPPIRIAFRKPVVTSFLAGNLDRKADPAAFAIFGAGEKVQLFWEVQGSFDALTITPFAIDAMKGRKAVNQDAALTTGSIDVDLAETPPGPGGVYTIVASNHGVLSDPVTVRLLAVKKFRLRAAPGQSGIRFTKGRSNETQRGVDAIDGIAKPFTDPNVNDWIGQVTPGKKQVVFDWEILGADGHGLEFFFDQAKPIKNDVTAKPAGQSDPIDDPNFRQAITAEIRVYSDKAPPDPNAKPPAKPDPKKPDPNPIIARGAIRVREDLPLPEIVKFEPIELLPDGRFPSNGKIHWELRNATGSRLVVAFGTTGRELFKDFDVDKASDDTIPTTPLNEGESVVVTVRLENQQKVLSNTGEKGTRTLTLRIGPAALPPDPSKGPFLKLVAAGTKKPLAGKVLVFDTLEGDRPVLVKSFDAEGKLRLSELDKVTVKRIELDTAEGDGRQYVVTKGADPSKEVLYVAGQLSSTGATDVPAVLRTKPTEETTIALAPKKDPGAAFGKIKHFFVLMLENRSFDHMLGHNPALAEADGLLGITRSFEQKLVNGTTRTYKPSDDADRQLLVDPPHELWHVRWQVTGKKPPLKDHNFVYSALKTIDQVSLNMSGFVDAYYQRLTRTSDENVDIQFANHIKVALALGGKTPEDYVQQVIAGFKPGAAPVINGLAAEFATCDRWFSSLPGPTWPNRLFVHAGTSGGLDDSPADTTDRVIKNQFQIPHIYEAIDALASSGKKVTWRVVSPVTLPPQVLSLRGMPRAGVGAGFKKVMTGEPFFTAWKALVQTNLSADSYSNFTDGTFTFIEPSYGDVVGIAGNSSPCLSFGGGSSQHPVSGVGPGDAFIKEIYETVANSPIWNESAFIVMYDEHGGFYDHVKPATAVPPVIPSGTNIPTNGFDFRTYGVRVPAIICSPRIPKGVVDHTVYDHSTVVATVAKALGITSSFGDRASAANTLAHLFTLDTPRATPKSMATVSSITESAAPQNPERNNPANDSKPLGGNARAFLVNAAMAAAEVQPARADEIKKRLDQLKTEGDARALWQIVTPVFDAPPQPLPSV